MAASILTHSSGNVDSVHLLDILSFSGKLLRFRLHLPAIPSNCYQVEHTKCDTKRLFRCLAYFLSRSICPSSSAAKFAGSSTPLAKLPPWLRTAASAINGQQRRSGSKWSGHGCYKSLRRSKPPLATSPSSWTAPAPPGTPLTLGHEHICLGFSFQGLFGGLLVIYV